MQNSKQTSNTVWNPCTQFRLDLFFDFPGEHCWVPWVPPLQKCNFINKIPKRLPDSCKVDVPNSDWTCLELFGESLLSTLRIPSRNNAKRQFQKRNPEKNVPNPDKIHVPPNSNCNHARRIQLCHNRKHILSSSGSLLLLLLCYVAVVDVNWKVSCLSTFRRQSECLGRFLLSRSIACRHPDGCDLSNS